MKLACPESQKRVSLKWGNIVSGSSAESSAEEASLEEFDVVGDSGTWALATVESSSVNESGKKKNFTIH